MDLLDFSFQNKILTSLDRKFLQNIPPRFE